MHPFISKKNIVNQALMKSILSNQRKKKREIILFEMYKRIIVSYMQWVSHCSVVFLCEKIKLQNNIR